MRKVRMWLAQAPDWNCWQYKKKWLMYHPIGLTAVLDFNVEVLSIRRDKDGKILVNEHTGDMPLSGIPTMLNNVVRDERML